MPPPSSFDVASKQEGEPASKRKEEPGQKLAFRRPQRPTVGQFNKMNGCDSSSEASAPAAPPEAPPPEMDKLAAKRLKQTPQEIIDEFWAKFTTKKPGQGSSSLSNHH